VALLAQRPFRNGAPYGRDSWLVRTVIATDLLALAGTGLVAGIATQGPDPVKREARSVACNDLCPRVAGCAGVAGCGLGRVAVLAGRRGDTMGAYPPHRGRGVRRRLRVVCPHVAHRGYDTKLLMQDDSTGLSTCLDGWAL
jgi:hypothetical protein